MTISSIELIAQLQHFTSGHMAEAENLLSLPDEVLNRRKTDTSWSALECLEHLNRYFEFYIPEIQRRIFNAHHQASESYRPGVLGDYFAKSMLPGEKMKKMKTFSSMNPIHSKLDKSVVETFLSYLKTLNDLLEKSKNVHLGKVKTSVSISKLVKLKLGDTLRVMVYHNERHMQQAMKAIYN